jgi:hypothetical protein
MDETTQQELNKKRESCITQWQDGAITFIEMVNWLYASVTKEEIDEFNELCPPPEFMGEVKKLIENVG